MSDLSGSTKSRGATRISQVIANARLESEGLAPSLDNPTRPKTPAGYDDKLSDPKLSLYQMKTAANSRSKAVVGASLLHKQLRDNVELKQTKTSSKKLSASVSKSTSVPLTRIVDSAFNASLLLNDLVEIENEFDAISFADITRMLTDQIQEFIKFLNSMQPDTELESDMTNDIEDVVMKFSGLALLLLRRDGAPAGDVLTLLRYNLRVLVPLLKISAEGGAFDLALVSLVLKQCAQALYQVCLSSQQPDAAGNMRIDFAVQEADAPRGVTQPRAAAEVYQSLEDGDIEYEDGEGRFVSQSTAFSANTAVTASVEASNNCDMLGVAQLLDLLNRTWKAIHDQIVLHSNASEDPHNAPIIRSLVESAHFIVTTLKLVSTDETDCKRLNSAGTLKVLVKGLKLFQVSLVQSYIKSALSSAKYEGFEDEVSDNSWIDCLAQIVIVVRNFSMIKTCKQQLFEQNVTARLCLLMKSYLKHPRVVVNCARVLAKLSPSDRGREQINANTEHIANLVNVVIHEASLMGNAGEESQDGEGEEHAGRDATEWPGEHTWAILTRVCFTLGNLTTTNVENRRLIGGQLGLAEHLLLLLQVCAESMSRISNRDADEASDEEDEESSFASDDDRDQQPGGGASKSARQRRERRDRQRDQSFDAGNEEDSRSGEREFLDATIKLVRLLANLSIDPEIGAALGSRLDTLEMLSRLLVSSMEGGSSTHEEMLLNVVAACTNITFFSCQFINKTQSAGKATPSKPANKVGLVAERMLGVSKQMATHLMNGLFHENNEVLLESVRVLGNLTRTAAIREELITHRTDEVLVQLLKHDDWEVVAAVCGVLVNLSADAHCKAALLKPSSQLLVSFSWTLRKVGLEYIELSTLICQALYNLLLGDASTHATAGNNPIQERIHKTLTEQTAAAQQELGMLQDNNSQGGAQSGASPPQQQQRALEVFVKVGTAVMRLIEKLRS